MRVRAGDRVGQEGFVFHGNGSPRPLRKARGREYGRKVSSALTAPTHHSRFVGRVAREGGENRGGFTRRPPSLGEPGEVSRGLLRATSGTKGRIHEHNSLVQG